MIIYVLNLTVEKQNNDCAWTEKIIFQFSTRFRGRQAFKWLLSWCSIKLADFRCCVLLLSILDSTIQMKYAVMSGIRYQGGELSQPPILVRNIKGNLLKICPNETNMIGTAIGWLEAELIISTLRYWTQLS